MKLFLFIDERTFCEFITRIYMNYGIHSLWTNERMDEWMAVFVCPLILVACVFAQFFGFIHSPRTHLNRLEFFDYIFHNNSAARIYCGYADAFVQPSLFIERKCSIWMHQMNTLVL